MSMPTSCCTLPPVASDYVPTGDEFKIRDLDVYETKNKLFKRVLICAYDIFGVHPNIRQVADKLAEGGFRVVIPDFFRGHEIDKDNFPPADRQILLDWIDEHGSWQKTVKADLLTIIQHYKETEHVDAFGIFGFCWGGRISVDAATEVGDIKAAGLVHPALIATEDAEGIKAPTICLPGNDDIDMVPFYEVLKKNLGEDKCAHHRFEDMKHGFVGARGDFADPLNAKRANECIQLLNDFFQKHVV